MKFSQDSHPEAYNLLNSFWPSAQNSGISPVRTHSSRENSTRRDANHGWPDTGSPCMGQTQSCHGCKALPWNLQHSRYLLTGTIHVFTPGFSWTGEARSRRFVDSEVEPGLIYS
jgi:hypothetical protein